jgi:hypothetical protein
LEDEDQEAVLSCTKNQMLSVYEKVQNVFENKNTIYCERRVSSKLTDWLID